ncbi:hypothetical protein RSK20926_08187 [Roseobacter sp. SK209-2-6]|uniref:sulfotransferase family 2 domain-containing protein n=1 Tax=Roseobacter sp. SK209-2-6 TaxID=388739 RepID=UPI0000F3D183|nr:sulfotransferase family 2 domain-containing protein [Roseobacter sp. SK209-2-6]EBA16933.1 hypothetical protein RSK20926_08187 [Roseobacter sp. SK209-2-6]
MSEQFDYFVVFAEMRTGSNFLESNLNAFAGLACYGEAFNPYFIGFPNKDDLLGVTQEQREADPFAVIRKVQEAAGVLGGFRYFHDHDPRVLDEILQNERCAKIILTRNPLESYISWKIAQATGQWKLTNIKKRKEALAHFDEKEFAQHVEALQAFQMTLLAGLQKSGQTAFYLAYEDLKDLQVMNGLAKWLGVTEPLEALDDRLKRQNPAPIEAKVENPEILERALSGRDQFNLSRTPNFEPRRGAAVPGYVAGAKTPLLYLPVRGGPVEEIKTWMAALDSVSVEDLIGNMKQKQLRQWKRGNPGFRSFTVLRHPALRVHEVFCNRILSNGRQSYGAIRSTLMRRFKLPLPPNGPDESYGLDQHRAAFTAFLDFLQSNLAEQTSVRIDAEWASQSQILSGFAEVSSPDLILREDEIALDLPALAQKMGCQNAVAPLPALMRSPFALSEIWNEDLEKSVASLYQRDYIGFGFKPWNG